MSDVHLCNEFVFHLAVVCNSFSQNVQVCSLLQFVIFWLSTVFCIHKNSGGRATIYTLVDYYGSPL